MPKWKKDAKEFSKVFASLIAITYALGIMLYPFTPKASRKLLAYFGVGEEPSLKMLQYPINLDFNVMPEPLFQKITKSETDKLKKFA